jgi:hypothetical protein
MASIPASQRMVDNSRSQDGPGAKDFDVSINSNIYNTLMSLCQKGKAITYIEQAAEFDGHGANKQLLIRYDGFSKQKLQSLKKCAGMATKILPASTISIFSRVVLGLPDTLQKGTDSD